MGYGKGDQMKQGDEAFISQMRTVTSTSSKTIASKEKARCSCEERAFISGQRIPD
jgi:hypothetical protein